MREAKAMIVEILKEMSKHIGGSMEEFIKQRGDHFRYPVYMNAAFMNTPLEDMELSVRAYHCLQRAGYKTIGDVVSRIEGRADLLKIRNMGKLSANEVIMGICCFQYSMLNEERKEKFVKRVLELNAV